MRLPIRSGSFRAVFKVFGKRRGCHGDLPLGTPKHFGNQTGADDPTYESGRARPDYRSARERAGRPSATTPPAFSPARPGPRFYPLLNPSPVPIFWALSGTPQFVWLEPSWAMVGRTERLTNYQNAAEALLDALFALGARIHTEDPGEYARIKKLVEKCQSDLDQARREFERGTD
jgi:hypothetical protein